MYVLKLIMKLWENKIPHCPCRWYSWFGHVLFLVLYVSHFSKNIWRKQFTLWQMAVVCTCQQWCHGSLLVQITHHGEVLPQTNLWPCCCWVFLTLRFILVFNPCELLVECSFWGHDTSRVPCWCLALPLTGPWQVWEALMLLKHCWATGRPPSGNNTVLAPNTRGTCCSFVYFILWYLTGFYAIYSPVCAIPRRVMCQRIKTYLTREYVLINWRNSFTQN